MPPAPSDSTDSLWEVSCELTIYPDCLAPFAGDDEEDDPSGEPKPNQRVGLGFRGRKRLELKRVLEGSAGERCGAEAFIGRRLIYVNDTPVTSTDDLQTGAKANTFRFAHPIGTPIEAYNQRTESWAPSVITALDSSTYAIHGLDTTTRHYFERLIPYTEASQLIRLGNAESCYHLYQKILYYPDGDAPFSESNPRNKKMCRQMHGIIHSFDKKGNGGYIIKVFDHEDETDDERDLRLRGKRTVQTAAGQNTLVKISFETFFRYLRPEVLKTVSFYDADTADHIRLEGETIHSIEEMSTDPIESSLSPYNNTHSTIFADTTDPYGSTLSRRPSMVKTIKKQVNCFVNGVKQKYPLQNIKFFPRKEADKLLLGGNVSSSVTLPLGDVRTAALIRIVANNFDVKNNILEPGFAVTTMFLSVATQAAVFKLGEREHSARHDISTAQTSSHRHLLACSRRLTTNFLGNVPSLGIRLAPSPPLIVTSVARHSPAHRCGVQKGDMITRVHVGTGDFIIYSPEQYHSVVGPVGGVFGGSTVGLHVCRNKDSIEQWKRAFQRLVRAKRRQAVDHLKDSHRELYEQTVYRAGIALEEYMFPPLRSVWDPTLPHGFDRASLSNPQELVYIEMQCARSLTVWGKGGVVFSLGC